MSELPPEKQPLIVHFRYLEDCSVKIAAAIRAREQHFFMKTPVKPKLEWKLQLIIRSIEFPPEQPITILEAPLGSLRSWQAQVLGRVAHSQHADVYRITPPTLTSSLQNQRSTERFFCLSAVLCTIDGTEYAATCVDVSEGGLGIKLPGHHSPQPDTEIRVVFQKPLEHLPSVKGYIQRASFNIIDSSTFLGVRLPISQRTASLKIVDFVSKKLQTDTQDRYDYAAGPKTKADSLFEIF